MAAQVALRRQQTMEALEVSQTMSQHVAVEQTSDEEQQMTPTKPSQMAANTLRTRQALIAQKRIYKQRLRNLQQSTLHITAAMEGKRN